MIQALQGNRNKGEVGESIIWTLLSSISEGLSCLVYNSLVINPCPLPNDGNLKKEGNYYRLYGLTGLYGTEIDMLFATENTIFVIEVKTYRASVLSIEDFSFSGASNTSKNPLHQNEMHCRQLYPLIYDVIPNGDSTYIQPVLVFTDKCSVSTSKDNVCVLNNLEKTLFNLNKVRDEKIDLRLLKEKLDKMQSKMKISTIK